MDEQHEEALDALRFRIWSGYYDQAEVFDIVYDEVYEADGEDEEWLRRAIDQEFRRKREAERGWPAVTDCNRLDRVFESLRGQGILTRHRCGLTIQDGLEIVDQLYFEAGGERSGLIGYCFYHLQDMEAATWGDTGLWLAFGSFSPKHDRVAKVGQVIRREFEQAGFTVEWDGTAGSRMLLKGFQWQRRSPVQKESGTT